MSGVTDKLEAGVGGGQVIAGDRGGSAASIGIATSGDACVGNRAVFLDLEVFTALLVDAGDLNTEVVGASRGAHITHVIFGLVDTRVILADIGLARVNRRAAGSGSVLALTVSGVATNEVLAGTRRAHFVFVGARAVRAVAAHDLAEVRIVTRRSVVDASPAAGIAVAARGVGLAHLGSAEISVVGLATGLHGPLVINADELIALASSVGLALLRGLADASRFVAVGFVAWIGGGVVATTNRDDFDLVAAGVVRALGLGTRGTVRGRLQGTATGIGTLIVRVATLGSVAGGLDAVIFVVAGDFAVGVVADSSLARGQVGVTLDDVAVVVSGDRAVLAIAGDRGAALVNNDVDEFARVGGLADVDGLATTSSGTAGGVADTTAV